MHHKPPVHHRRNKCRCVDKYIQMAIAGFFAFLLFIHYLSQSVEEQINASFDEAAREQASMVGSDGAPLRRRAPDWSPKSINVVDLSRRMNQFVQSAVGAADVLFAKDTHVALGLTDVALLVLFKSPNNIGGEVEAFADRVAKDGGDAEQLADAVEALESVQAALRLRGYDAEAGECEQQRRKLIRERAADVAKASPTTRWSFERVPAISNAHDAGDKAMSQLMEHVAFDQLEFLLDNWILGGGTRNTSASSLRRAYAQGVTTYVRTAFQTIVSAASNYTYVDSGGTGTIYPRMCGLPAVLSRGARHNAHPSAPRAGEDELTSDQVLQAAESLAATCLRLYADAAVLHFDGPLQYTSTHKAPDSGPPFRPVAAPDGDSDACNMPLLLLRSFYELFEYTKDPIYAAWASYVMSGDAYHCPLATSDAQATVRVVKKEAARYVAELRYTALIFLSLECDLYRESAGARGVCGAHTSILASSRHRLFSLTKPPWG